MFPPTGFELSPAAIVAIGRELVRERKRLETSGELIRWSVGQNEIYARYFPKGPPARIFINVPAWPGPFDIEIDCIAAL
jgi:hypothetical protein